MTTPKTASSKKKAVKTLDVTTPPNPALNIVFADGVLTITSPQAPGASAVYDTNQTIPGIGQLFYTFTGVMLPGLP